MATKVKIEYVCYGLPSDLGIPFPPLDLETVIDFDAPSSPAGAFSWAATVQAEVGDPRPMTSDEIEDSLKILATMDCPGRSSRHQPRKISRRRKLARVQPSKEKCHQDGAKAMSHNEQGGKMEKAEMAKKRSPDQDNGSRRCQSTLKSKGNEAKSAGNKNENDGDIGSGWRNKAQPVKPPKPIKMGKKNGKKEGQRKMIDTQNQGETNTAHGHGVRKATYTIEKKETDSEGREKADSNRLGMADTRERGRIKEARKMASQIGKREKYSEGRKKAEPNRLEMAGTGGGGETKEAKKAAYQIEKKETDSQGRKKAQPTRSNTTLTTSSRSQHGQGMKHKAYQTSRHQDPSSKDEGKGDQATSRDKGVRKSRRRSEKSKKGIASTGFDKEIYEHIPIDRYHGETDIEYHDVSPLSSSDARPRDQTSRKTRRRSKNNTNENSKQEMGSVASLGVDKEIDDEGLPHGLLQDATDLGYRDLGPSVAYDHDDMSLMSVGSGSDGVDSACDFQPLDNIWEWSMATHNQPGFQSVVATPDCPDFHPPDNNLLPDLDLYLQILSEHGRGFYDDHECNYTSSSPDIDLLYPDHAYLYGSNLPLTAT